MQVSQENPQQFKEGKETQTTRNTPPATGACRVNREPADKYEADDDVSDGMVEHKEKK